MVTRCTEAGVESGGSVYYGLEIALRLEVSRKLNSQANSNRQHRALPGEYRILRYCHRFPILFFHYTESATAVRRKHCRRFDIRPPPPDTSAGRLDDSISPRTPCLV